MPKLALQVLQALLRALLPFMPKLITLLKPQVAKLGPVAKSVVTLAAPAAYAILNALASGTFDGKSTVALITGLVSAVLVYIVPNETAATKLFKDSAKPTITKLPAPPATPPTDNPSGTGK